MRRALTHTALACSFALATALPVDLTAQTPQSTNTATATTTRERGILQAFIEDRLSDAGRQVEIEGFRGALSGRAEIDLLRISDAAGPWLQMQGVVLDWNRAALIAGRLDIAEFSAQSVALSRAPQTGHALDNTAARAPFALPELPVALQIAQLKIDALALGADLAGQEVLLAVEGAAQLAAGAGQSRLSLTRLAGPRGQFVIKAGYSNETRSLLVDLALDEAAGGLATTALALPDAPSLQLSLQGEGPIDSFRADLGVRTDGTTRFGGALHLHTDSAGNRSIAADVSGDLRPFFAPRLHGFFGSNAQLQAKAQRRAEGGFDLQQLDLSARALSLQATGQLDGAFWPERLSLNAQVMAPEEAPIALPFAQPGTQLGRASLTLDYDRATGDSWRADAQLRALQRPKWGVDTVQLRANGRLGRGKLGGTLALTADGLHAPDPGLAQALGADLSARLVFFTQSDGGVALRNIMMQAGDANLRGQANIAPLSASAGTDIGFSGQSVLGDLSRFATLLARPLAGAAELAIKGQLNPLTGAGEIILDGQTQALQTGQAQLDGLLADGPATLRLDVARDTGGTDLRGLSLRSSTGQMQASGALAPDGAGRLQLAADVADFGRIDPRLSGPARLTLSADGNAEIWGFSGQATLAGDTSLRLRGQLAQPRGSLTTDTTAQLSAPDLAVFAALAGRPLRGAAHGTAQLTGSFASGALALQLNADTLDLAVGLPMIDSQLTGQGSVALNASITPAGQARLGTLRVKTAQMQAEITTPQSADTVQARLELKDGSFLAPELAGALAVTGSATPHPLGQWTITANARARAGTAAQMQGRVAADFSTASLQLQGQAPLGLVNARIRPRSISGMAQYDLRLEGPVRLSSVAGTVRTTGARLSLPQLGQPLGDIDAQITLQRGQAQLAVQGALGNGGTLALGGQLGMVAPYDADLRLSLAQAVFRDPALYQTVVDGTLALRGPLAGGAVLGGQLELGQTDVFIAANSGPSFGSLPGLVHVNTPSEVARTRNWAGLSNAARADTVGPIYRVDMQISAPARIFVRGRGLDAELGGQVRLQGQSDAIVPQGSFQLIRGRLDVLGRRLTLTEGSLNLQGSFDPTIRFAATSQTEDTSITLALQGVATKPELQLSAAPELPQDEILARLLFGRNVAQISPLQAVRLAAALRTLSGGGDGLAGNLRRELALDDFDVSTTTDGQVEARAGKYLSDQLYSDVILRGAGETEVQLNLQLSPDVTLRGRVDSRGDTGIGLHFEKDY